VGPRGWNGLVASVPPYRPDGDRARTSPDRGRRDHRHLPTLLQGELLHPRKGTSPIRQATSLEGPFRATTDDMACFLPFHEQRTPK
jgi:hypothetical protein